MFANHLKVAFRYLKTHKSFTLVNVFGLTLGFFCYFLLNAYVLKERSFDQNQDQVYRLLQKTTDENGTVREMAQTPPKVGIESKAVFDEIENQTQIFYMGRINVGNAPATLSHQPIAILDDHFLEVFDFEVLEGTTDILKNHPNGIILTESIKNIYFGEGKALGKILKTGYGDYPVVGVLQDFPENSHLENLVFISSQMASEVFSFYDDFMASNWSNNQLITYFKVADNANLNVLADKITVLNKENYPVDKAFKSTFTLQDIKDIHLYENEVEGEMNKAKGNGLYVKLFFWVGVLILLVACFNYAGLLNIAFIDRSKEIGLRRIVGAGKMNLLVQFLCESIILIAVSMMLAYGILWFVQPYVKSVFNTELNLAIIPWTGIVMMAVAGLVLAVVSVAYPFWTIIQAGTRSSLKQTIVVKSKLPFRRFMLTFQFIAVISFITASFIFNKQMNFLEQKELGFTKNGLATIDVNSRILRNQFEAIKSEFLRIPEIKAVSVSSRVPGEWKNIPVVKAKRNGQAIEQAKDMLFIGSDKDFLNTYGIQLEQGTNFSGMPADSTKVLVNEAAVLALGLENPIGQFIEVPFINFGGSSENLAQPFQAQIAGVVKDFQMEDFRTAVKPLVIANHNNPLHSIDYYTLQIASSDWAKTITALKEVNDSFDPKTPAEFHILNDKFSRFFAKDIEHFKLLNFFAIIIVFLSCMGLFAMSAFVAKSRTKEMGIRKVLGSNSLQLLMLLSKDFIKLVLFSLVIAAPICWYFLSQWLSEFAYRIPFSWLTIVVSGILCLLLTFITVGIQSLKAATVSLAKSLRSE